VARHQGGEGTIVPRAGAGEQDGVRAGVGIRRRAPSLEPCRPDSGHVPDTPSGGIVSPWVC
jgi:hypothetical protein